MLLNDPDAVPENYNPLNGVNVLDMILINQHILGITPLPTPYNWIAADANNSGSITPWDIVYVRKIILGLDYDYPAGTWRFVPEYLFNDTNFETSFMSNPFTANYNGMGYPGYMDQVTLNMDDDAAAVIKNWSFGAVKVGDVDCNAQIDQFSPPDDDDNKFSVDIPATNCVNAGDDISLSIRATSSQSVQGYQLGIKYDELALQFLGTSIGSLPDFSFDNFASTPGKIKSIWYKANSQGENITIPQTLFNLRFKTLVDFCSISQIIEFEDEVLNNVFYGSSGEPVETSVILNYETEGRDGELLNIYPNPASNNISFDFELQQSKNVEIRLSDYLGHQLVYTNQYSEGSHSYTFSNLTSLTNGPLNYVITIGGTTFTGILIKSQE